jgi:hypothetical protein
MFQLLSTLEVKRHGIVVKCYTPLIQYLQQLGRHIDMQIIRASFMRRQTYLTLPKDLLSKTHNILKVGSASAKTYKL